MTPPPLRRVTASPTVPPRDTHWLKRLAERVGWTQTIIAAACAFAGVVTYATLWTADRASKADIVQTRAAAEVALAPVAAEVRDLTAKQAVLEAGLAGLKRDMDRLTAQIDHANDQLVEIAKTVGARTVPPPATTAP